MADFYDEIDQLTMQDEFVEAIRQLNARAQEATGNELARVQRTREKVEEKRSERARGLTLKIEEGLGAESPQFTQIEILLDKLNRAWPEYVSISRLQHDILAQRRKVKRQQDLNKIYDLLTKLTGASRQEVDEIEDEKTWRRLLEKNIEAGKAERFTLAYEIAVKEVYETGKAYIDDEIFSRLGGKANKIHDAHRNTQMGDGVITAQVTEDVSFLLDIASKDRAAGKYKLPWYEWRIGSDKETGKPKRVAIAESFEDTEKAFKHLQELAEQAANGKADEKLDDASQVYRRTPHAVIESLKDILSEKSGNYGLYKYLSPDKKRQVQHQLDEVQQFAKQRDVIDTELAQITSNIADDPRQQWRRIKELAQQDEFARKLDDARQAVRGRLIARLSGETADADALRRKGKTDESRRRAQAIKSWLDEYVVILPEVQVTLNELIERCAQFDKVGAGCTDVQQLINKDKLSEAKSALETLKLLPFVQQQAEDYPQIQELEDQWQSRQDLEAFIRKAEGLLNTDDDATLASQEKIIRDDPRLNQENRLSRLLERVQARRAFLAAEKAMSKEPADYDQARSCYRAVINRNGDDTEHAQQRLKEAEAGNAERQAVTTLIRQTEMVLQDQYKYYSDAEKAYRETLGNLHKFRTTRDERWARVWELTRQIREKWSDITVAQIAAWWDGPFSQRPVAEIERLIRKILCRELKRRDQASEWIVRALPDVYEIRAQTAQKNGNLSKALKFVQMGLLSINYSNDEKRGNLQRLRCAIRKARVYRQLENESDNARRWEKLKTLADQEQDDIEVRLDLIEIALDRNNVSEAGIYLRSVQRRFEASESADQSLRIRGSQLAERLAADKDVADAKQTILKHLGLPIDTRELGESDWQLESKEDPRDLRLAASTYQDLLKREIERAARLGEHAVADRQRRLQHWYDDQRNATLRALTRELNQHSSTDVIDATQKENSFLTDTAPIDSVRARWRIALKISVLNPNSPTARPILQESHDLWLSLSNLTEQQIKDNVGPRKLDVSDKPISAEFALDQQIAYIRRLKSRIDFIKQEFDWQTLVRTDGSLSNSLPVEREDQEITRILSELRRWLNTLEILYKNIRTADTLFFNELAPAGKIITSDWVNHVTQQMSSVVESQLPHLLSNLNEIIDAWIGQPGTPVYDDLWGEVDNAIADINPQFLNHRTVTALHERVKNAKSNHRKLIAATGRLLLCLQLENFATGLSSLQEMRMVDEQSEDAFGVRANLKLTDLYPSPTDCTFDQLVKRLDQKQQQLEAVKSWLEQGKLVVDWDKESQHIVSLAKSARFEDALRRCQDALQGLLGDGRTNGMPPAISLQKCVTILSESPEIVRDPNMPLSRRVDQLLDQSRRILHDAQVWRQKAELWANVDEEARRWLQENARYDPGLCAKLPLSKVSGIVSEWRAWHDSVEAIKLQIKEICSRPEKGFLGRGQPRAEFRQYLRNLVSERRAQLAPEWSGWDDLLHEIERPCN